MSDDDLIRRGDALALPSYDSDGDPAGQWDHHVFVRRDAIQSIAAVQPTVKPLVWRDDGTNGHETDHAFGFYEVYPSPKGDMLSRDGVDSGVFPTLEAAKAAAQADYEARILSALDMYPTVSPDVAPLVEALENVIGEYDLFRKYEYERGLAPLDDEIHEARATLARVKGVM